MQFYNSFIIFEYIEVSSSPFCEKRNFHFIDIFRRKKEIDIVAGKIRYIRAIKILKF